MVGEPLLRQHIAQAALGLDTFDSWPSSCAAHAVYCGAKIAIDGASALVLTATADTPGGGGTGGGGDTGGGGTGSTPPPAAEDFAPVELAAGSGPDVLVLHCLPAHRGEEISTALFEQHAAQLSAAFGELSEPLERQIRGYDFEKARSTLAQLISMNKS